MSKSNSETEEHQFEPIDYYAPLSERSTPIKITGKLIDSRCYGLDLRNYDNDHKKRDGINVMKNCAVVCAQKGVPVAIIPYDRPPKDAHLHKDTIMLITAAPPLADYMSKIVEVEGYFMLDTEAILPEKITYNGTEIPLGNPMG